MKNRLVLLFLAVLLALGLTACGADSNAEPIPGTEEKASVDISTAVQEDTLQDNLNNSGNTSGKDLVVHFLDVGQGDSILFKTPAGKVMLIDGGPRTAGERIVAYLKKAGIHTIDAVVATHPHEDHIGGLVNVLGDFAVKTVYDPGYVHTTKVYSDFLEAIKSKGIKFVTPKYGDTISLDPDVLISVLHPDKIYEDINDNSIVLKVQYGSVSFLMTGDAEETAEDRLLLNSKIDIKSTVLKVGHHGSSTSSDSWFLDAVSPKYAVICVGKGNDYGHPHWQTLTKLKNRGVETYRTDINGDIVFNTDGTTIRITTEKEGVAAAPAGQIEGQDSSNTLNSGKYVGSVKSDKYHYPNCRHAKNIAPKNEIWFYSKEEAVNAGYRPCGGCKP